MALAGFAYSCMVVSSFSRAQQKVLDMGYPNDMNTSTMISGTFKIYLETFSINFLKPGTSPFFRTIAQRNFRPPAYISTKLRTALNS